MSWWGKIIGGAFGFAIGGPIGALLGAALGHQLDQPATRPASESYTRESRQTAFFTATFAVMGHLCKVDGHISESEIALARSVMNQMELSDPQRKLAMELFRRGKEAGFPLDDTLRQLRDQCRYQPSLLRMFLEIQIGAALADGVLHQQEDAMLQRICLRLGVPIAVYQSLLAMLQMQYRHAYEAGGQARRSQTLPLEEAYALLGLKSSASDAEIKRAYRKLISQHHPDKLVARGLPEEMMKLATQKTQEIRRAYERIQEARGMT
jgi:DnaJ like chaperone protein